MLLLYPNRVWRIKVTSHTDAGHLTKSQTTNGNDAVRLLGIILAIAGAVGIARSVRGTLAEGRPKDVAFALLTIAATIVTLVGLGMAFVPGFLD